MLQQTEKPIDYVASRLQSQEESLKDLLDE
jgi:hypothetical protein